MQETSVWLPREDPLAGLQPAQHHPTGELSLSWPRPKRCLKPKNETLVCFCFRDPGNQLLPLLSSKPTKGSCSNQAKGFKKLHTHGLLSSSCFRAPKKHFPLKPTAENNKTSLTKWKLCDFSLHRPSSSARTRLGPGSLVISREALPGGRRFDSLPAWMVERTSRKPLLVDQKKCLPKK